MDRRCQPIPKANQAGQPACRTPSPSLLSPASSPTPSSGETARRRRTSDGDASEAHQTHPAVPRVHHRQIPVGFSFPSISFFGFVSCSAEYSGFGRGLGSIRTHSGTFRDGDLLVNKDGLRIVSRSEGGEVNHLD